LEACVDGLDAAHCGDCGGLRFLKKGGIPRAAWTLTIRKIRAA
jgi:hypothetical protein